MLVVGNNDGLCCWCPRRDSAGFECLPRWEDPSGVVKKSPEVLLPTAPHESVSLLMLLMLLPVPPNAVVRNGSVEDAVCESAKGLLL